MKISVRISEDGRPELLVGGRPWIQGIGLHLPIGGTWYRDGEGELVGGPWEEGSGEDLLGAYHRLCRTYSLGNEPLLYFTLRMYGDLVWLRAELLRGLSGLSRADSFEEAIFLAPTFRFSEELGFFLTTFGLGGSGDGYPGGYWPTAQVGKGPGELPKEAFAPLVLFSQKGALAIAPASHFLTSPMVRVPGGAARGLSGAVDYFPAGMCLDTVFAFGEDVPGALMRLGDVLLAQGGKARPRPGDHPLLSTLGYWNAYGGYYTELFRPMDAGTLEGLAGYFRREGIPVRYFGLDLWYPYQEIGRAIRYVPDPRKYPEGLAGIAERTGLPYVLHLSALAEGNAYGADGADPGVYREIARELKEQRGIAAWHDWLRTQQHLTPRLRADPEAAEKWFSGMAQAFSEEGLPVLLCMHTMGMALASTSHKNVIAARTYTDYIFGQKGQLENLAAQGLDDLLKEARPRQAFIYNNILVGMVSYALGLAPFHDLFITNTHHPEGFGDELAEQEAILRALSAGPVGIGDKLGEVDKEIVRRLVFPDGSLAQPDRPLFPLQESLGEGVLIAWTETRFTDDLRWIYLVAFNVGDKEEAYRVDTHRIYGNEHFIFDYFGGQLVKEVAGTLPPARARYYILVPEIGGMSFLGLKDKFVTMPTTTLTDFQINKHEIRVTLSLPRGEVYPLAVCPRINRLEVKPDDGAEVLKVEHRNDLHVAWVKATQEKFSIRFGSKARRKR